MFSGAATLLQDEQNQPRLAVGKHEVTINSISEQATKTGTQSLQVSFTDSLGRRASKQFYLIKKDGDLNSYALQELQDMFVVACRVSMTSFQNAVESSADYNELGTSLLNLVNTEGSNELTILIGTQIRDGIATKYTEVIGVEHRSENSLVYNPAIHNLSAGQMVGGSAVISATPPSEMGGQNTVDIPF